jgi:hypothetical protein
MTTKDHFHANAICAAFEAASEATRAEFLQWLGRDRVPSPWPTSDQLLDALGGDEPRPQALLDKFLGRVLDRYKAGDIELTTAVNQIAFLVAASRGRKGGPGRT